MDPWRLGLVLSFPSLGHLKVARTGLHVQGRLHYPPQDHQSRNQCWIIVPRAPRHHRWSLFIRIGSWRVSSLPPLSQPNHSHPSPTMPSQSPTETYLFLAGAKSVATSEEYDFPPFFPSANSFSKSHISLPRWKIFRAAPRDVQLSSYTAQWKEPKGYNRLSLYRLLGEQSWANHLTSLNLFLYICKRRIKENFTGFSMRKTNKDNAYERALLPERL